VSTRDKQNIETQVDYLKDYATREGLEIFKVYTDVGESGSKDSRPQFDIMLADMRDKKFTGILVYKLDRIGRSLSHLVKLFEEFKKRDIDFISATQAINTTTPEGRMFLHILMTLAEYERELTVSRIKAGLELARKTGKPIGKRGKDKKKRRRSGYALRWIKNRQTQHLQKTGEARPLKMFESK
jgi:DNA invertase Pin-like site-specific DNA recombinase